MKIESKVNNNNNMLSARLYLDLLLKKRVFRLNNLPLLRAYTRLARLRLEIRKILKFVEKLYNK